MACLQCTSVIDENEQYYVADDMGPEIISVIERYLGHQVDINGVMCSQCFGIIMHEMSSDRALPHDNHELEHSYDSNVCVRCRTSLFRRRAHSIPEGPERQNIAETIAPREIPEAGLVCFACWVHTQRTIQHQGVIAAPAVNMNICVCCRQSLAQTRRHSIPADSQTPIKSRHSSGRTYYTYILLAREGSSWDDKISSYYCSCISGKRTVGCCAHIMTIVWYLGWARYQDSIEAPASFLDGILIRDVENE